MGSVASNTLKDAGAQDAAKSASFEIGIFSLLPTRFLADLHLNFVEGGFGREVAAVLHHGRELAFLMGEPASYGCEIARL